MSSRAAARVLDARNLICVLMLGLSLTLTGCIAARARNDSSGSENALHSDGQISVARVWNEVLLEGIRHDYARPTVHARNLWHSSAAMYDAWAAYDTIASTWLLGKLHAGYDCKFARPRPPQDIERAREEAISFAAYRIARHRFRNSPGAEFVAQLADDTLTRLGYDPAETRVDCG